MQQLLPNQLFRGDLPLPSAVHVWTGELDRAGDEALAFELLSADERERALRFRFARDRRRFTVARAILRTVLAGYVTHPARDIEFTYGAFGKPALVGGGGQFNLSHSGELVVIAVSALSPVGVDVEQVDRSVDFDGVVGSLGSAGERVAFAALPTEDRRLAFFRWWTRKEAVMKALGTGLSLAPESFEVSITTDDARVKSAEFPQSVSLSNLSLADGYIGSLAVCGELRSVQLREFGGFGLGGSG